MIEPGPNHFLRIPPFPRHRAGDLVVAGADPEAPDPAALAAALVEERVGGRFWSPQEDPWTRAAPGDGEAMLVQGLRIGGDCGPAVAERIMAGAHCRDPFSGAPMGWIAAVRLLGKWRRLIESNRRFSAVFGVAGWKRETVDAMLWDGTGPVRHRDCAAGLRGGDVTLSWVARAPGGLGAALAAMGARQGEIEDGFIRSAGLGADCVPPFSVIFDEFGSYVDPSRESGLERILAGGGIAQEFLSRAVALRESLVAHRVSKYGVAGEGLVLAPRTRRRVLVVGQVEDDRAVVLGGAGLDNLALLERVRGLEPGAEVIYRPHPDVEAGHRKGRISDDLILQHADAIERGAGIAALLEEVDGVHVISSLAGFEALLRGVEVVTHGVPFYAGWGLTRDLGPVPERRKRLVSLDEMVAAALILYPRYVDPVTRLPCPVEVLVERMAAGQAGADGALVRLRRMQGVVLRVLGIR